MKTTEHVESLRRGLLDSRCFPGETLKEYGERYQAKLITFRRELEDQWDRDRDEELKAKADQLGCSGNLKLAGYVDWLERHLGNL